MKKTKRSTYEHNHTHNPRARESDERKLELLRSLEIKRLQGIVDKQIADLSSYVPIEKRKKQKIDPAYQLKGAARVAQEYYRPPGYEEETEPINILEEFKGRLSENELGKVLLTDMLALGIAMHNLKTRFRDAIKVFKQMLSWDRTDKMGARHHLLRCYLDIAAAEKARELLNLFPDDTCSLFAYSRALIEYISVMLKEEGSSDEIRDNALAKAYDCNPFTIWTIVHYSQFADAVQHADMIKNSVAGSIEDAIAFFDADISLWTETDGAKDWVRQYVASRNLEPPSAPPLVLIPTSSDSTSTRSRLAAASNPEETSTEMFRGMYYTALEMAEEAAI